MIRISIGSGGPGGHGTPRFYNFSIGIRFLLCKLADSVKPLWSPKHKYVSSYVPDGM